MHDTTNYFVKDFKIWNLKFSGVRIIASRILHEICLLLGELAVIGTELALNARLGIESNLLIEQNCH